MKKKILVVSSVCVIILIFAIVAFYGVRKYQEKHAKIEVQLVDKLVAEVGSEAKMTDYIISLNGKMPDEQFIDTKTVGTRHLTFSYENDDHFWVSYDFSVDVIDTTKPIVWLGNSYSVNVGSDDSFVKKIMCADNYDANPVCKLVGEYDLNTIGSYPVILEATDFSGNQLLHEFTLNVTEPKRGGSSVSTKTIFGEALNTYKNENTEMGLDISFWQGDVDFHTLKANGVEFVFLRVGTSNGIDGEYILDKKFEQNITRAKEAGIPVGIYFYSYANNEERARADARWVLEQIKGKDVTLPIAFDWENWSFYNDFHLSLMGLSDMATGFIETVEAAGYEGMLYSSKSYLEKVWPLHNHKVWLAHYTDHTNYRGEYEYWQMCSDGVIPGINGFVDINIRYKNLE
ncbi:MAG: hypothetical protein HFI09_04575 [Bacilli bacterium]|nr:hypothetical protein [Bacilli bacterium]